MTTKTWNGASDSFSNAGDWSPNGVPVSGDEAIINSGTVTATGTLSGVQLALNEASGATASSTLVLASATLDSASSLIVTSQQVSTASPPPVVSVTGSTTFAGTGSFYGTRISFQVGSGATLINTGTMNFYGSSPTNLGGGTFENDGTLAFVNPNNLIQVPDFSNAISGTGTIALGKYARFQVDGSVSSGQTVVFNDGANGNEALQLNSAGSFAGTINGFSSGDNLFVINTPYTGATYTSTGSNSGTLAIFNGGTQTASLNFIGQYTLGSFSFNSTNIGGGQTNLQITTSVNNDVSAGLPAGYQNGGNGNSALPVYRFFDKVFGTHLFTQDASEVKNILATRPDLQEETNNFGAVSQSSPAAEAVYRFFSTVNGTHFFTADRTEYLGLTTKGTATYRPDLTPELGSTFYEDSVQLTGDVPVYRFFDTVHGTQFLTGDQTEFNNITAQGTSTYRADLHLEGIAFYAPAGSFYTT